MARKFGFSRQLAMSLFKKEATFDAGVTWNSTNACSMRSFIGDPAKFVSPVIDDSNETTGNDWPTQQQILRNALALEYNEPKAKPNSVFGIAALAMGQVVSSTQDAAFTAYRNRTTPIAPGGSIPSIQVEEKYGTVQNKYTGVKCDSFKIIGKSDGLIGLEAKLIGASIQTGVADAFPSIISESWLLTSNMRVWMESGANIVIAASPTQQAQNISSGTPTDLKSIFKGFEFEYMNNLYQEYGYGSAALVDVDPTRRKVKLKFSIWFQDLTQITNFLAQTALAIEFEAAGAVIAGGGGVFKYGMQLVVPKFQITNAPTPTGGVNEGYTQEIECTVLDNGTDPICVLDVYNAKTGYLAA